MKEVVNKILYECNNKCTLIAVSKTKSVDMIREVYDLGVRDFGENKVQELLSKMPLLPSDINWHMIGHLQTNKVKDIVGKVKLIHSVDSIKLAQEINKQSIKKGIVSDILIEINIANEESKYGFKDEEVSEAVKLISNLSNVKLLGFMCVAPYQEDGELNRIYFKTKYKLDILSMGMSGDYRVAIEEGSSYIRVGTLIFGKR